MNLMILICSFISFSLCAKESFEELRKKETGFTLDFRIYLYASNNSDRSADNMLEAGTLYAGSEEKFIEYWKNRFGSLEEFPLVALIKKISPDRLENILTKHPDINVNLQLQSIYYTEKISPLGRALLNNDREIVDVLIKHGAQVDQTSVKIAQKRCDGHSFFERWVSSEAVSDCEFAEFLKSIQEQAQKNKSASPTQK